MNETTYFTDHWKNIEDDRIERYEQMFTWRPDHLRLLESLDLQRGQKILDYGCGPGFMSQGMADVVGENGHVYGVDLNQTFVANANERVKSMSHVSYLELNDHTIPLKDDSVDRLLCKNVLEYVPSLDTTLSELARVLRPNGKFLLIDSDWGFLFVEPWGRVKTEQFFTAASIAFNTPEIGRRLRQDLKKANFKDVEVRISAGIDTNGGSLSVLLNMASYIKEFDKMPSSDVDQLILDAEEAIARDEYMFCLPQFLVTGSNA